MVPSVSIILFFYKCCVYLEGCLHYIHHVMCSNSVPPLLTNIGGQRHSRHPLKSSHLTTPSPPTAISHPSVILTDNPSLH